MELPNGGLYVKKLFLNYWTYMKSFVLIYFIGIGVDHDKD